MARRKIDSSAPTAENPEWTARTMARAKHVEDIPALAQMTKRKPGQRGPQRAPRKVPVSLRIDYDVVMRFKATGDGWQSKMNDALAKAAKALRVR